MYTATVVARVRAVRLPYSGRGMSSQCALDHVERMVASAPFSYPTTTCGEQHDRGLVLDTVTSSEPDAIGRTGDLEVRRYSWILWRAGGFYL